MADFSDYRTDSEYIFHYSDKLSPAYIRTALLMEGVDMPARERGEPFRYLELGFGQGLSLNIHAAANAGEYWGVDFLPAHSEEARTMAGAAGSDCTILTKSFAEIDEMSAAGKLPQFDCVVFHGVWSWVNDENRAHILNILDRILKPGGVVYNSYNAMPGWAFFRPVRDLMVTLLDRYGDDVDIRVRAKEIVDYLIAFAETGEAAHFGLNPRCLDHLKYIRTQSMDYVAHEFLNTSWHSFYFREVAADLGRIGCKFVSSANPLHQSGAAIRPAVGQLVSQVINPNIRESLRDFVLDKKFRMDYFVRDPKKLPESEQVARLGERTLKLVKARDAVKPEVKFDYETIALREDLFNPILDRLNENGRTVKPVRTVLGDMLSAPGGVKIALDCLRLLLGGNIAKAGLSAAPPPESTAACRKLNRELCRQVFEEGKTGIAFLAAPTLGAGIRLKREELLLLYCRPDETADADKWAEAATEKLIALAPGNSRQVVLEELRKTARNMLAVGLPEMDTYGVSL